MRVTAMNKEKIKNIILEEVKDFGDEIELMTIIAGIFAEKDNQRKPIWDDIFSSEYHHIRGEEIRKVIVKPFGKSAHVILPQKARGMIVTIVFPKYITETPTFDELEKKLLKK